MRFGVRREVDGGVYVGREVERDRGGVGEATNDILKLTEKYRPRQPSKPGS